jgi:diguanylate cyclase (GGDEF)-like protein
MFHNRAQLDQRLHRRLKRLVVVTVVVVMLGGPSLLALVAFNGHHQEALAGAADDLLETQQLSIAASAHAAAVRSYVRTADVSLLADRAAATRAFETALDDLRTRAPSAELDRIAKLRDRAEAAFGTVLASADGVAAWERDAVPATRALREAVEARLGDERARFADTRTTELAQSHHAFQLSVGLVAMCLLGLALAASILVRTGKLLFVEQRAEQDHNLRSLLEQIPVGVLVANRDGTPAYANTCARTLLELANATDLDAAIGDVRARMFELGTERTCTLERLPLNVALAGRAVEANDVELRRTDGERMPLHICAAPIRDRSGHITHAVSAFQDVRELLKMGGRDALTGLVNRTALEQRFARERMLAERGGRSLCVAVIDLDRFKAVNDTYGHPAGDRVLRETARVVAACLRRTDIVARWGGEEFVVVLPDTTADGAARAMDKALEVVRELGFVGSDGARFNVTFSAGVAEVGVAESLEAAVARADVQLYRAKLAGRNRVFAAVPGDAGRVDAGAPAHRS